MISTTERSESGVALVLVLLTFSIIGVLAGEFARAMREDATSTRNFKQETVAHYVALAGINEAILAIQSTRALSGRRPDLRAAEQPVRGPIRTLLDADGAWVKATFNGHQYQIRATDEAGLISLNEADDRALREIMLNLGYTDLEADEVADSILDWRDPDDLHRINGAESDYYEGMPRPYRAKNADFDALEELLLVRGVTREMFFGGAGHKGLREVFSVFNSTKGVNLRSVSAPTLLALSGLGSEQVDDIVGRRTELGHDISEEIRMAIEASGVEARTGTPLVMTLEARVLSESRSGEADPHTLAHIGIVVRVPPRGDGFRTYRWYDAIYEPDTKN